MAIDYHSRLSWELEAPREMLWHRKHLPVGILIGLVMGSASVLGGVRWAIPLLVDNPLDILLWGSVLLGALVGIALSFVVGVPPWLDIALGGPAMTTGLGIGLGVALLGIGRFGTVFDLQSVSVEYQVVLLVLGGGAFIVTNMAVGQLTTRSIE